MNSKTGLLGAAWAITCGAAFLIGRSSSADAEPAATALNDSSAPIASSRNSSRTEGGTTGRNSRTRTVTSRSGGSIEDQMAAVRLEVTELKNIKDPIERAEKFLEFVKNLSPGEYLSAIDAYREGGINNEQFGEYRILLSAWARVDPLEALDYASDKTGTPFARQTILATWAQSDTEGAVSWARDNFNNEGDENRANPWLIGVIQGISESDLGRATQLLEELPLSRGRGEALDAVFPQVMSSGAEDAKRWVSQLTDERLKEGAAARLANEIAQTDPEAAAAWAQSLGTDVLKKSVGSIVNQWADADLDGARAWVESQPDEVIASAGPNLVQKMVQNGDITTASTWLADFEGNPAFDDSVRSLVWNSMGEEPAVAADWIMKLTSARDQERTFHRVLGGWMQRDREAATNYVANNPVPDSIKRRAGMTQE